MMKLNVRTGVVENVSPKVAFEAGYLSRYSNRVDSLIEIDYLKGRRGTDTGKEALNRYLDVRQEAHAFVYGDEDG